MEKNESIKKYYELLDIYQQFREQIREEVKLSDIYDTIKHSKGDPYEKICKKLLKPSSPYKIPDDYYKSILVEVVENYVDHSYMDYLLCKLYQNEDMIYRYIRNDFNEKEAELMKLKPSDFIYDKDEEHDSWHLDFKEYHLKIYDGTCTLTGPDNLWSRYRYRDLEPEFVSEMWNCICWFREKLFSVI
jgi:hypothetical protein